MKPEYQCPDCKGHTFNIDVIDSAIVRFEFDQDHTVLHDGDGNLEWDDSSKCSCEGCGKMGTLADFKQHVLYVTSDTDVPSAIRDCHGEVVLGLCRNCGRGEIELEEPCTPRQPATTLDDVSKEIANKIAADRENFLAAWIAETGMQPSEAVLVHSVDYKTGENKCWVELKTNYERKADATPDPT